MLKQSKYNFRLKCIKHFSSKIFYLFGLSNFFNTNKNISKKIVVVYMLYKLILIQKNGGQSAVEI